MKKLNTKIYPSNPLGIIALFVFLNETLATVTLKFMLAAESRLAIPMTVFVILFPLLVSVVFFIILWHKSEVLYAPGDFHSDDGFRAVRDRMTEMVIERPRLLGEVLSQLPRRSGKPFQGLQQGEELSAFDYTTALMTAETALSRDSKIDVPYSIELLEKVRPSHPQNRTLAIYLARLYRRIEDYDAAILTLRDFIRSFGSSNDPIHRRDMGDAYYNIACYHALKAAAARQDGAPDGEVTRLKQEALEAARMSIELNPKNSQLIEQDEDLDTIRAEIRPIANEFKSNTEP